MVKKIQSTGHDGGSGSSSVTPDGEPQEGHDIAVHGLLQTAIQQGSNAGNVCPAIYGALQIATETPSGWRSHRVPLPTGLVCVIFVPEGLQEGKPLPQQPVDRKAAIFNVGRVALLVNCFCTKNFAISRRLLRTPCHNLIAMPTFLIWHQLSRQQWMRVQPVLVHLAMGLRSWH